MDNYYTVQMSDTTTPTPVGYFVMSGKPRDGAGGYVDLYPMGPEHMLGLYSCAVSYQNYAVSGVNNVGYNRKITFDEVTGLMVSGSGYYTMVAAGSTFQVYAMRK
jgi:hypothetical protein